VRAARASIEKNGPLAFVLRSVRPEKPGYPKDRSGFTILAERFRSYEWDILGHRLI
jgi:hypothetical protein